MRNVRGTITLEKVPKLEVITSWHGHQLRKNLRLCPYSNHFGSTEALLRLKFPKKRQVLVEVTKMIVEWNTERQSLGQVAERSFEESPVAQYLSEEEVKAINDSLSEHNQSRENGSKEIENEIEERK